MSLNISISYCEKWNEYEKIFGKYMEDNAFAQEFIDFEEKYVLDLPKKWIQKINEWNLRNFNKEFLVDDYWIGLICTRSGEDAFYFVDSLINEKAMIDRIEDMIPLYGIFSYYEEYREQDWERILPLAKSVLMKSIEYLHSNDFKEKCIKEFGLKTYKYEKKNFEIVVSIFRKFVPIIEEIIKSCDPQKYRITAS